MQPLPKEVNVSKGETHKLLKKIGIVFISLLGLAYTLAFVSTYFLPFEKEKEMFSFFYEDIEKGENIETKQTKLVRAMTAEIDPGISENTYVICSDEKNAYSMIGGGVFVTTSLLQSLKSENELFFILAHEVRHSREQHVLKSLAFQSPFMVVSMLFDGAQTLLSPSSLVLSKNSRNHENDSDDFALEKTLEKYGHVGGLDNIFNESVIGSSVGKVDQYLHSHPTDKSRIEKIKQYPEKNPIPLENLKNPEC